MRAVFLRDRSPPALSVDSVQAPKAVTNEVRLRPLAVGICGSDLGMSRLDDDGVPFFSGSVSTPVILGHEICAEVVENHIDGSSIAVGDVVVPETLISCQRCTACRQGDPFGCDNPELLGMTRNGGMAEELVVPHWNLHSVNQLFRSHRSDSQVQAICTLVEPFACAANAYRRAALPHGNHHVLIVGLGPLGMALALLAEDEGLSVTGFDRSTYRVQLATAITSIEAHHISVETRADIFTFIDRASTDAYDLIIEAAGLPNAPLKELLQLLKSSGTLIYLARSGRHLVLTADHLVTYSWRIMGSRGPNGPGMADAIRFLDTNYDRCLELLTDECTFDTVTTILRDADMSSQLKIVFRPR